MHNPVVRMIVFYDNGARQSTRETQSFCGLRIRIVWIRSSRATVFAFGRGGVFLQLPVKRLPVEPQALRRTRLVAAFSLKHALDVFALQLVECEALGDGRRNAILALALLHRARQVVGTDEVALSKGHGALDDVFQFTHVSRPLVAKQIFLALSFQPPTGLVDLWAERARK